MLIDYTFLPLIRRIDDIHQASHNKTVLSNRTGQAGIKINLTPNLAAMLTGHGRTRAYLHRFKLRGDATCICGQGDQTTDHLLNQCTIFHIQREVLKQYILKKGTWSARKQELITNYRNSFSAFIESIEFELL